METFQLPSDEEIRAAYQQGEEAVIALSHRTVGRLAAQVQAFEVYVSKNSQNSGNWYTYQWEAALAALGQHIPTNLLPDPQTAGERGQ